MPKLTWDQVGERLYETGVDRGVLYPQGSSGAYETGVAWNGLVSVTESPTGAEPSPQYADNIKYLNLVSAEEFGFTIEAFMSPSEFDVCDGSAELVQGALITQQTRRPFGFSYRTKIGNDTEGTDHGYKIHLVYGAMASPSDKTRSTVNESPEAVTLSWECTTTPVEVAGFKPTAHVIIDSTLAAPTKLAELEKKLYGDEDAGTPTLPLPGEVKTMLTAE